MRKKASSVRQTNASLDLKTGRKLLLIIKASVKHQQKNGKLSEIEYNFEEQKYSY